METWLELDLNKLKNNYKYIKEKTRTPICSVIKADSYGLGVEEIAIELEKLGTDIFAVAFFNEALELRKVGIKKEILIFNYISTENLEKILDNNMIVTLYSLEQLKAYIAYDLELLKKITFHIKLNTGMNRLGFDINHLEELVSLIKENKLNIKGIYSHFAHAEDYEFSKKQNDLFLMMAKNIEEELGITLKKHLANSTASLKYEDFYHNMVRIGMLLYGLQPLYKEDSQIKCIFTWKSKITNLRKVKKGQRISYGEFLAKKDMCIATVPVGYSHGYMRQLSNKGKVYIEGKKYQIIGNVCMDQILVDLTGMNLDRKLGVEVELLGPNISPEYLANLSGTIADDIICKLHPKIKRVVKNNFDNV